MACGAQWTLLPFSHNWREGGEPDVMAACKMTGVGLGANCWDLGAHFGIHTVGLALRVGAGGEVAAFEPDPAAFARLSRHIAMNRLPNVKLFNAAASDLDGQADLIATNGFGSTFSHFKYEDEITSETTTSMRVRTLVLDKLVEDGQIKPARIIKVDVQGHGAKSLQGAIRTITNHRPTIIFSSHSQWELADTRYLLEQLSYRPFDVSGTPTLWESFMFGSAILVPEGTPPNN